MRKNAITSGWIYSSERFGLLSLPPQIQNSKLFLAVFTAVLGNFSFGYSLVYSSPVLPRLTAPNADPRLRMGPEQAAWFGSIYMLGAAAGGLGAMLLNDMIGRKLSIMTSAVPSAIGSVATSGRTAMIKRLNGVTLRSILVNLRLYRCVSQVHADGRGC